MFSFPKGVPSGFELPKQGKSFIRMESFTTNKKADMSDDSNHCERRHADLHWKPNTAARHCTTVTHCSNSKLPCIT